MANTSNNDRWYFTKEQLENTPSRKFGFDAYKELQYRQQAANFIQDMGQRLQVSQLCINTAIVYMHRFYVFHSFTNFPWHQIATAALFLAAKVEEQPRKLEYVIRAANICKNPRDRTFDINSERYAAQSQDLVFNENVLLQTLGFDVAIDHPHTYVVKCCHLVRASKDLAQTSYFMASNSLHLTTMCIQYKPTVVACFCILLACKWSNWEIPLSNERKEWYTYVDPTVTAELLQQLTNEFLVIFENCPSRLKEKIGPKPEISSSPLDPDKKDSSLRALEYKGDDHHKHRSSRPGEAGASSHRTQEQREREYKERKEKERIAHMSGITLQHQSHHHRPERPPSDPAKMKQHSRPHSSGVPPYPSSNRNEPRDILREATKDSPFGLPTVRDHTKDVYAARSDNKEVPKRESLPSKSSSQTDPNSLTNYSEVRQLLKDPSRSRMSEPPKPAQKQEAMRRYEEQKQPPESVKKPHSGAGFDKAAYHKSSSSTSHKVKSPFNLETKSVPKPSIAPPKPQFNGNVNGSYESKPPASHEATDITIKTEPHPIKEEIPTPAIIKRPSLFSPDQTPQHHPPIQIKTEIKTEPIDKILSPITSPPSVPSQRNRNYSSSSEPELRPTMKKIDQVEGFENLMRDSTIGVGGLPSATDALPNLTQQQTEMLSPIKDPAELVNGLETNPTLISNLLKEVATKSHLSGVAAVTVKQEVIEPPQDSQVQIEPPTQPEKEHRHHKSKKKKDKHKHKEKSKEEKEKKKKHKDKDREKHKHKERKEENLSVQPVVSEPIKIKIQMGTIQPMNEFKIKIPKDKIKTEGIADPPIMPQLSSGGLKIKIPKEKITNSGSGFSSLEFVGGSSSGRKRDREKYSPAETPPAKVSKSSHKESKQNGRHSYNKVSEPTLPSSFASTDQIDSSVSNVFIRTGNVHSSNDGIKTINNVQQQFEENNNKRLVNDLMKPCSLMKPSPSKCVSSTVDVFSPGLLSPISPNDSLETFNPPEKISPMSVSPVSSLPVSLNKQFFGDSSAPDLTKTSNASPAATSTPSTAFHPMNPPAYSVSQYDPYGFSNVSSYQKQFTQNRQNARNARKNNQRQPPPMYPQQNHSMTMPVQMDFNQMAAYNSYQMPPPTMPNVSMPPPNYGMYTAPYYGTYFNVYQSQMAAYSGAVAQPPLPTDAPPVHEAPPPPPPE